MAQDFATNMFDGDNVWSTDLQNIENALFTLNTMFSGTIAPANAVQGKPWMDTGKGVLKRYATSSWVGLMHGDVWQKLWVYRNSAMAGRVVDATVSDRVLAFKGGTTYITGGASAGSWTVSGLSSAEHTHGNGSLYTPAHNHKWYEYPAYGVATQSYNSAGALQTFSD
nr:hypothetical protein [Spirochaetales bacterium]